MGIGTGIYRLGAVLPGIVLSTALLLVLSASVPATLLVAYVIGAVVLACGAFEAPAVRVLGRARRAAAGEEQLLRGLAGWLDGCGQEVPDLYVASGDLGPAAAEPCGQHSVVVAPRMLGWLLREQVPHAVVGAVVAQAAASLRVGPSRFDLAVRLLTAPGAMVVTGFLGVAQWFTWLPGVLALWRIRMVFGIVAVWQCVQAHEVTIAVTTGALISASYTGPACARAWRRRVEADADRLVASAGLGEQLEFAVRSADEPGAVDRIERIRRFAKTHSFERTRRAQRALYVVR
jgi:hypothetical protein